eukprot:XP_024450028.1 uncharacterized protein LOC112326471 [Populus trichocarpa]
MDAVECYKCHNLGNFQYECPKWDKEANYVEVNEEYDMLLMSYVESHETKQIDAWFLDLGCSNHMRDNRASKIRSPELQGIENFATQRDEKEKGLSVKCLRTDRGGEFTDFCKENGIKRCPTLTVKNITPQEAWSGVKPSVEHFCVFGYLAHAHVPNVKRDLEWGENDENNSEREERVSENADENDSGANGERNAGESSETQGCEDTGESNETRGCEEIISNDFSKDEGRVYERRVRRPPSYLSDYVTRDELTEDEAHMVQNVPIRDPLYFEEAVQDENWSIKWVYKTKYNERGEIDKHKTRLIAKGYSPKHGIDYTEVFAPVTRMDTVRMIIALAAQKRSMLREFDMTYLGSMRFFLSIEVLQRIDGIFIYQKKYALEILKRFEMLESNEVSSSIVPGFKVNKDEDGITVDETYFKQLVGSLMYLTATRPDMIDYAGDVEDRKSTNGYVFLLSSGVVTWSSKKQPIVTLSTIEVEFVATAVFACQAIWMKRVLREFEYSNEACTLIRCDNNSTIKLSRIL